MEAKEVIEKILSDAKGEADGILAEAKKEVADQQKEADSELSEYRARTGELAAKAGTERKLRILAKGRMDIRKEHLAAKVEVLNEVFAGAKKKIESLDDDRYRELMTSLMIKAVETGDEEVIVGKNETRINDKLLKEVNRQLGEGLKRVLRLSGDRADIGGGFILKRGNVQVNVSSDVLVEKAKEELEVELVKEMFN